MKREPRLRFPGFSGEWEEKKLDELANCLDNLRKPLNSQERSELKGDIPYYGANGVVDYVNDFIFDKKLILLAEDGGNFENFSNRPIAQLIKGKSWVNNHAHVLESRENADFLFFSLEHKDVRKYINGTSRSKLNKSDMLEIKIPNPTLAEQEKIADCLTAMDESIDSQQQKVEQLKAYKKGLLQQLFSQSFRFPGFEGEWEEKKLGEMAEIRKGQQLNKNLLQPDGKYYALNGGIEPSGYTDKYNSLANTISISEGGNSCGYVNFNKDNFWSGGHCYTLENLTNSVSVTFLFQSLKHNQEKIMNLRVGTGLPNIQKTALSKIQLQTPSLPEQQKIADCLSTLDEVIELETQKLEQLCQYKKGLLQQLFV